MLLLGIVATEFLALCSALGTQADGFLIKDSWIKQWTRALGFSVRLFGCGDLRGRTEEWKRGMRMKIMSGVGLI